MDSNLDGALNEYKETKETTNKQVKQLYWNMAIGLQKVDNLVPSTYMMDLVKENIDGKISAYDVEEKLISYYETKDINNKVIAKELECDLVATRINELLNDNSFGLLPITFKNIHKYLFKDIYDFAGIYRNVNITKDEPILRGDTVNYLPYHQLEEGLEHDFNKEKEFDYSKLSMKEKIEHVVDFTSSIWQAHPFREGNTRTTAVLIEKYLRSMGFNVNNDLFKEHSVYFRNALVRANYTNVVKDIYPTNEYLIKFYENLLLNKNNMLLNDDLIINE
ncbi:MAG: Fic family protein [Bacilli bacterium]